MENKTIKVGIGAFGILMLFILYGRVETIEWFKLAILGGLLSIFFLHPVLDFIFGNFTKEDSAMVMIGLLYLIFYFIVTNSTLKEFTIDFLKSLVVVSIISLGLDWIKEYVSKTVK